MIPITNLTNSPKQNIVITLSDNSILFLYLEYIDSQQSWFYSITNVNFKINNRRLVASPFLLRQFRNQIPFDIFVNTTDTYDPMIIDDFVNGRIQIVVLENADILILENA